MLKLYLDVCCLNRPFDDLTQMRVRLEADAVLRIMERIDNGDWAQFSSQIVVRETEEIGDPERRASVQQFLPKAELIRPVTATVAARAAELEKRGFKPGDALHLAAAEEGKADVLLTCDDRFCRLVNRCKMEIGVRVVNPFVWLEEQTNGTVA